MKYFYLGSLRRRDQACTSHVHTWLYLHIQGAQQQIMYVYKHDHPSAISWGSREMSVGTEVMNFIGCRHLRMVRQTWKKEAVTINARRWGSHGSLR